jgi:hypothetical protein
MNVIDVTGKYSNNLTFESILPEWITLNDNKLEING